MPDPADIGLDPSGVYALCRPLGCQGISALQPLAACQPSGAWTPAPIPSAYCGDLGPTPPEIWETIWGWTGLPDWFGALVLFTGAAIIAVLAFPAWAVIAEYLTVTYGLPASPTIVGAAFTSATTVSVAVQTSSGVTWYRITQGTIVTPQQLQAFKDYLDTIVQASGGH